MGRVGRGEKRYDLGHRGDVTMAYGALPIMQWAGVDDDRDNCGSTWRDGKAREGSVISGGNVGDNAKTEKWCFIYRKMMQMDFHCNPR